MGKKRKQTKPQSVDLTDFNVPEEIDPVKSTQLPDIISVGKLVQFKTDRSKLCGWVIQNPNSAGGQTNSYVIASSMSDYDGVIFYPRPVRVHASNIIQVFEIDLP